MCMLLLVHIRGDVRSSQSSSMCVSSYIWGQSVGWCGLVDFIVVAIDVRTACCSLTFSSAHWATLHHAATHLNRSLLRRRIWITLLRHHPEAEELKDKTSRIWHKTKWVITEAVACSTHIKLSCFLRRIPAKLWHLCYYQ